MRAPMTSLILIALVAAASLTTADAANADVPSAASPNRYALDLSGVRIGFVKANVVDGDKNLVLDVHEIAPSLVALVDGFAQGKAVTRDVRLTSGAVVRRANDAKLFSVKLPALGSGGTADVELAFVAPKVSTQPLLSAKEAPPSPSAARIAGFRVDVSGMKAIEAPKIGAVTVTQRSDGSAATGEVTIEVAAGGAPPFVAWERAGPGKPATRTVGVEYVDGEGATIMKLQLDRCAPTSVTPLGASGTTRIALACGAVRPG